MGKQLKEYKKDEFAANKDTINSLIMEQACDIAFKQLKQTHPNKGIVEVDPDGDGESTRYKSEFQEQFDAFYNEEYNRTTRVVKFDYSEEDGILKN